MPNNYTTVTSQSWFSRIGQSLVGTLFGLLIFLAAFVVLFWNEGRAVKTHKMLQEGAGIVVSVPNDRVDAANEGALVHVSGKATTKDVLSDPVFNVSVTAIKLARKVEMLQWHEIKKSETRKKIGGGTETTTTYNYRKDWSETLVDSSKFHFSDNKNPVAMVIESEHWQAENVTLGAFSLSTRQIGAIGGEEKIALTKDNKIKKKIAGKARLEGGTMFLGSKAHDKVGDFRIQLKVTYPTDISVISGQKGTGFAPYETEVGGAIAMVNQGIKPASEMFEAAEATNTVLTWIGRFGGLMMMFFGLKLMVRVLSVLADIVPLFGNIVGGGTSIIAFLIALVLSLITIAIAWMFYRPLLSGGLIAVSLVVLWFAQSKAKKVKVATDASEDAAEFGR